MVVRAPDRYDGIDFTPPKAVADAARRGLELRKKHGRGGTSVGVARARDLSNRRTISPKTARRMRSYFARHDSDRNAEGWADRKNPSAGWIAWLLWGGDPGRAWANRLVRRMDELDEAAQRAATLAAVESQAWGWLSGGVVRALSKTPTTERERAAAWRAWVRRAHTPGENRLRQRWVGYLRGARVRTVDRLRDVVPQQAGMTGAMVQRVLSATEMAYVLSTDEEFDEAYEHIGEHRVRAIMRVGFSEAAQALDIGTWAPTVDPSAVELAAQVRRVSPYTIERTRAVIQSGLIRGESVETIARTLSRDVAYTPQRAVTIARTEATRLNGVGTRVAYDDAANQGARFDVQWLSARDSLVRPTHTDADGLTVAPGESFTLSSGATGEGPGQFSEAAEVVNCRCTTIPILRG